MSIRPMLIEDYEDVYCLWSGTAEMGMRSLDDSRDGVAKFLKRNPNTNFVAQEGNQLAGIILCGHDGRRGYIYHTAVKPDYRKKGIGKALVTAALDALKKEQINKAALVAFCANDLGNKFWQSVGFDERTDLIYRNKTLNEKNI
jgi:N-acetylglutamate synthase